MHQDGTFVQIALAAAERDLFSIIESELAVAQWAVHQDCQLRIGAFDGAQITAVLLGDCLLYTSFARCLLLLRTAQ